MTITAEAIESALESLKDSQSPFVTPITLLYQVTKSSIPDPRVDSVLLWLSAYAMNASTQLKTDASRQLIETMAHDVSNMAKGKNR